MTIPVLSDSKLVRAFQHLVGAGPFDEQGWDIRADADLAYVLGCAGHLNRVRLGGVRLSSMALWLLADWLRWLELHDSDSRYAQVADKTGYSQSRLMVAAWVGRTYPRDQRRAGLTFTHHEVLSANKWGRLRDGLLDQAAVEVLAGQMVPTRELISRRDREAVQNPALVVSGMLDSQEVDGRAVIRGLLASSFQDDDDMVPPYQVRWREAAIAHMVVCLGEPKSERVRRAYVKLADHLLEWLATSNAVQDIFEGVSDGLPEGPGGSNGSGSDPGLSRSGVRLQALPPWPATGREDQSEHGALREGRG